MALTLPTTRYVPKYGSIVRLAPAGETIETVVVSATAKPAGSVFTDWETLGCIEEGAVAVLKDAGEPVHCFNATTGLWETIRTEDTDAHTRLQVTLTLQSVTVYLLQLAYAAAAVNGTTGAYVPASMAGGAVQGWVKVQTQVGAELVSVLDLWAEVVLTEPAQIANRTAGWKPKVQITQLRAALEAGAFGSVSA
jgi:hypothetical protein